MNEAIYAYTGDAVVYTAPQAVYEYERTLGRPFKVSPRMAKLALTASKVLASIAAVILAVTYAPSALYALEGLGINTASLGKVTEPVETIVKTRDYKPRLDATLPKGHFVSVPAAGISTTINEASLESYEDALRLGVWRVPNFGEPTSVRPVILAAHKYGYLKWSIPYRLQNSFYSLSKASVGDVIEVTWDQRKYVYEIYATEEGEAISDYSADIILYTCKDLDSSVRYFVYGRLLEI